MKYLIRCLLITSLLFAVSCDKPEMDTDRKVYYIGPEGGVVVIETFSTGIDEVYIHKDDKDWLNLYFGFGGDVAETDTIPTKALLVFDEEVWIEVLPNRSHNSRTGRVTLSSFTKSRTVKIKQSGR